MRKTSCDPKKSCLERLFATTKRENIAKAIVIENNQVYTYGYDRINAHKTN